MNEPIRVLQVVTHMNRGGLETMLMNYYRHIDRDKVQFDFLTHRPYNGDYGEEIKSLGGKIYHLPRLNPLSIPYKTALKSFFNDHPEYRIVHVHQDCMSSVILKEAKKSVVPTRIAHCHSSSQDKDIKYPIKRFFQRFIPRYATDYMACGQVAGEWMFPKKQFVILNNAIDIKMFSYDAEKRKEIRDIFGFNDDEIVVGHVGRFSAPKNHSFIIDVFKRISEKEPKVKLMLVGNDREPLADDIKRKVKMLSLDEKVIFTGLTNNVDKYLMAMDVFLFPSLYEGFPVTVVEALTSGLECIISDKVPPDCMITDRVHMIPLFETVDHWASSVIEIYENTVRKDMSDKIMEAGFDIKSNALWLEEYYLQKVKSNRK